MNSSKTDHPEIVLSPLRYPGAKRRQYTIVSNFLKQGKIKPDLLIEPFAGGAGISLQLLGEGIVDKIGLGDLDPWLASFWQTAFFDTNWLIKKIEKTPINLETWKKLKSKTPKSIRDQAFTCLFLNRTSFSGILSPSAGPLGGWSQSSEYRIDCRFNKASIINRIQKLSNYSHRVSFIQCSDWRKTMSRGKRFKSKRVFYYLDPPFFKKADKLYRKYFVNGDHKELRDYLSQFDGEWLLSYDDAESFRELYHSSSFRLEDIRPHYSASTINGRERGNEVLVTNHPE